MQLLAMFAPTDKVRFRKDETDNTRSRPGENLKPLADWLTGGGIHPVDYGELVRVNPLTGAKGQTKAGVDSYDAQECIARSGFNFGSLTRYRLPTNAAFGRA